MFHRLQRAIPLLFLTFTFGAHAQFYKLHGGSISVGATGQFTKQLNPDDPDTTSTQVPFGGGFSTVPVITSNHQQFTTTSAGFLTSLQFHPVAWAGVEVNYGFTHYSERFAFNYNTTPAGQRISVPNDVHEATAAYQFHPRHIPFQPFVNIGGGALDFNPRIGSNQWRGAGLVEAGFDIPTHSKHIGFRIEGRSLYYRAPNFYQAAIATQTWRATVSPSVSTFYRF